jgi:hypothetical protein
VGFNAFDFAAVLMGSFDCFPTLTRPTYIALSVVSNQPRRKQTWSVIRLAFTAVNIRTLRAVQGRGSEGGGGGREWVHVSAVV